MKLLKPSEVEGLVCGDRGANWTLEQLSEYIIPVHGYERGSAQYQYLLRYLSQLSNLNQRLFLQYVTGSPRLPHGGFAKLNPRLTISKRITPEGDFPDVYLPSVMTCQNYLKIPEYSTYEVLRDKFDYALNEGQNSFTLS